MRLLIIDDEESPRESLRFILKDRYDLTLRENGTRGSEGGRQKLTPTVKMLFEKWLAWRRSRLT